MAKSFNLSVASDKLRSCLLQNHESIYSFTCQEMQDMLVREGFARYASDQIYGWIYKKFVYNPDEWTNVSARIRDWFSSNIDFFLPRITKMEVSKDGTRKYLLEMKDGECVEAVTIPAPGRLTLCVSTQVGCAIGCKFCRTAFLGFKRNLFSSEIVGQFLSINRWVKDNVDPMMNISNVVYMGQGEPLHNFENVKKATLIFMEDKGTSIGRRRMTLSTSGLVPQMHRLLDFPPINIAISLHAASDDIRDKLMPINKKYDLRKLFEAIKEIPLGAHRRITYEYLLIDGLNDRLEDVEGLCRLLDKKESKINLIPFNEFAGSEFKRPSDEKIRWFQDELLRRDYVCTTRLSKGADILAACGQLAGKQTVSR